MTAPATSVPSTHVMVRARIATKPPRGPAIAGVHGWGLPAASTVSLSPTSTLATFPAEQVGARSGAGGVAMRHPDHNPEPQEPDDPTPRRPPTESSGAARRQRAADESWEVERVETAPMTPEQYETAVSTLATLIAQWLRDTRPQPDDQAA